MNSSRWFTVPSMGRGKIVRFALVLVSLTLTATLSACSNDSGADADAPASRAIPVLAEKPSREDAVRSVTANGNVVADRQVTVFSSVAGRVVERAVHLASSVRDSQIIVTVDHAALDLGVKQARAALAAARQNAANLATELQRIRRLYAAGGASRQQLDAANTRKISADKAVEQARAALDQAVVRRNEADIRAPFDGVIGKIYVEVGDMVGPGVPVAIVVDLAPLVADVQVPERDLGAIVPGEPVSLTVAAYGDSAFRGTVRRVSPIIDPVTRMAEVEVLLPNSDGKLKPGMFAQVSIEVGRHENAIMVPSNAVLQESHYRAGEELAGVERVYYLFVKRGGKAHRKQVRLGYVTGDKVEILSGLSAEDSVVVEGQNLLQDGQRVTQETPSAAS